jgi:hypothetical protein
MCACVSVCAYLRGQITKWICAYGQVCAYLGI